MLSALATSAVPGFQAVSAQSLSTPERDAALVHDVNSFAWLVELARTEPEEALMSARHSAARALSEGLRSRLSFRVPKLHGTTDVGGKTLSVSEYLPGRELPKRSQLAHDVCQELANDRLGSLACVDDFGMAKRMRGNTGGQISDERQAQDFHSCFTGSDRFESSGHTDDVATHGFCHLNFSGCFIVRATELNIDTFIEACIDRLSDVTQPP